MSDAPSSAGSGILIAATNRRARFEYSVVETLEAGLELRGTEVKSIRDGQLSLAECYGVIENGQAFLLNMHIQPYKCGNVHNHDPKRKRRLLLHSREIAKLYGQISVKGQTLVPLKVYFRRGRAKVELAVCRGKQTEDKREAIKRRTSDREAARAMSDANRH